MLDLKFGGFLSRLTVKDTLALEFLSLLSDSRTESVKMRSDAFDFTGHGNRLVKYAEQMQQNDHADRNTGKPKDEVATHIGDP